MWAEIENNGGFVNVSNITKMTVYGPNSGVYKIAADGALLAEGPFTSAAEAMEGMRGLLGTAGVIRTNRA